MKAIDHSREALQKLLESAGAVFKGKTCRCIFHDDHNASAGIYERAGKWRYKCQSCGASGDLEDLRKLLGDKPPINANGHPAGKGRIVAVYPYVDEAGKVLFEKVRLEPKGFYCRAPGGKGNIEGVRRVLYRLSEIIAATAETIIFIAEGEKDTDNLRAAGLVATCNFDGASKDHAKPKWKAEYSEYFRGRIVGVIADKDAAGRAHAANIADKLAPLAKEVRVFEVPGDACKDASDYISTGADGESFIALFDAAPVWVPKAGPITATDAGAVRFEPNRESMEPMVVCMADVQPREVSWLWRGRIPRGRITLLVGRPGGGKSFLTTDIAARVSNGSPFPDGSPCKRGSVLLITAEDDNADTIRPRLDAHGADVSRIHQIASVRITDEKGERRELFLTLANEQAIEKAMAGIPDLALLVIDPIGSFLGGKTDAHRDNDVRAILAPIAQLAEKYGVAVLIVAHRRKSPGEVADDLALGSRAFTGIARAVWHLCRKRGDERRYLLPGKNNLAAEGTGLAFTIGGVPPRLNWEEGEVEMNGDDGLAAERAAEEEASAKPGPEPKARSAAANWLRKLLADGPLQVKRIRDDAEEAGLAWRTVERAASEVEVDRLPPAAEMGWRWRLPAPSPDGPPNAPPTSLNSDNLASWREPTNTRVLNHGEPPPAKLFPLGEGDAPPNPKRPQDAGMRTANNGQEQASE